MESCPLLTAEGLVWYLQEAMLGGSHQALQVHLINLVGCWKAGGGHKPLVLVQWMEKLRLCLFLQRISEAKQGLTPRPVTTQKGGQASLGSCSAPPWGPASQVCGLPTPLPCIKNLRPIEHMEKSQSLNRGAWLGQLLIGAADQREFFWVKCLCRKTLQIEQR